MDADAKKEPRLGIMNYRMKRILIYVPVLLIAMCVAAAGFAAVTGGHARASEATYQASDTNSTLKFTGDVQFNYSGYNFTAASAEIITNRIDTPSGDTTLDRAEFDGDVKIISPSGGALTADKINVVKQAGGYLFTGNMKFNEDDFHASAGRVFIDNSNTNITVSGGISAQLTGLKGLRGDDGSTHTLKYSGDGLVYNRPENRLTGLKGTSQSFEYDGLTVEASDISLTISGDGLIDMAAGGNIKASGYGVSLSGLNAEYSGQTGELKLSGDVSYRRGNDTFTAAQAVWPLHKEGNQIRITGGEGTVELGGDDAVGTGGDEQ
jgi:lipopolysaccharide export system protein LptA